MRLYGANILCWLGEIEKLDDNRALYNSLIKICYNCIKTARLIRVTYPRPLSGCSHLDLHLHLKELASWNKFLLLYQVHLDIGVKSGFSACFNCLRLTTVAGGFSALVSRTVPLQNTNYFDKRATLLYRLTLEEYFHSVYFILRIAMASTPPPAYSWFQLSYNIVLLIGIPGNLIIMKVYSVKSPRSSAHIFIIGLAIADLFVSLLRPFYIVLSIPSLTYLPHTNTALCRIPRFISTVSVYSSVFLTSAVAIDRYYCVCRPHERKMTPYRAKLMVSACLILSLIVSLPNIFAFGLKQLPYGLGTVCTRTSGDTFNKFQQGVLFCSFIFACTLVVVLYRKVFRAIKIQRLRLKQSVHSTVSTGLQETTLAIVSNRSLVQPGPPPSRPREAFVDPNVPTSSSFRHIDPIPNSDTNSVQQSTESTETMPKQRGKKDRSLNVEGRTSKMLLLTTTVFIVTWIPPILLVFIPQQRLSETYQNNPSIRWIVQGLTNIVLINHAINPVIYGFVNPRFRKDCRQVFQNMKWPCNRSWCQTLRLIFHDEAIFWLCHLYLLETSDWYFVSSPSLAMKISRP